MSRMDYGLTATPHPQPIDRADVREGDRVRMVVTREGVIRHGCLVIDSGVHLGLRQGAAIYLLDRPDPDAALIEAMARAMRGCDVVEPDHYTREAHDALAALRETHTIEPRPTGGDLHA